MNLNVYLFEHNPSLCPDAHDGIFDALGATYGSSYIQNPYTIVVVGVNVQPTRVRCQQAWEWQLFLRILINVNTESSIKSSHLSLTHTVHGPKMLKDDHFFLIYDYSETMSLVFFAGVRYARVTRCFQHGFADRASFGLDDLLGSRRQDSDTLNPEARV